MRQTECDPSAAFLMYTLKCGQQCLWMFSRINLCVRLRNHTIRPDNKCHPFGGPIRCRLISTKSQTNFTVGIAQQWIFKALLFDKFGIGSNIICAGTQNLYVFCCKVLDSLLESYAFSRSATCAGAWIKPQHHGLATKIAQLHLISGMVFHRKIRCRIPYIEHLNLLFRKRSQNERCQYRQTGSTNPV